MKKISRNDLQGLRCQYPILTNDEMRRYIGGYSDNYWGGDWFNSNPYFVDPGINGYSSYGYEDFDGGYLPDVIIYGSNYPGGNGYPGDNGYPNWNNYDSWWGYYDSWWGGGYSDWGYGYDNDQYPKDEIPRYSGLINAIVNNKDCFFLTIGRMLGRGPVEIGNKFGDYLKNRGLKMDDINKAILGGMSSNYLLDFMKNDLGVNTTQMDNASFKSAIVNNGDVPYGMGLVYMGRDKEGKDQYHSIIVEGVTRDEDGDLILRYTDPQIPNSTMILTPDHIMKFYKIEK